MYTQFAPTILRLEDTAAESKVLRHGLGQCHGCHLFGQCLLNITQIVIIIIRKRGGHPFFPRRLPFTTYGQYFL